MNINEAFNRMLQGNKITHEYFSDDEYLYIDDDNVIKDEQGYDFEDGWESRLNDKLFYLGWSVKNE